MLTPEQIKQIRADAGVSDAPQSSSQSISLVDRLGLQREEPSGLRKVGTAIKDVGVGAVKGLTSTLQTVASPITKMLPEMKSVTTGETLQKGFSDEELKPTNTAQKVGKGVEQVAEFLAPATAGMKVAKVPGALNLVKRVVTEILGGGGVTLAQTGDVGDAITGGVVSGAFPVAGKTMEALKNANNAGRMINSLIKTKLNDLQFGKNPGKTVAELGIVGNSIEDLEKNIITKKNEIGTTIGAIMTRATQEGKKVNLSDVFSPITDAIKQAKKAELTNAPLITKLENLLIDLTKKKKLENLTPDEAFQLKQDVASLTKFTGNPSDDKAANSALMNIYGKIRDKINQAVDDKELPILNDKYANLITAEKATGKRADALQGQNLVSLGGKTAGASAGILSLLSGTAAIPAVLTALAVGGGVKLLSSPAVKTRLAKWMASKTDVERKEILKVAPYLKGLIITNLVED